MRSILGVLAMALLISGCGAPRGPSCRLRIDRSFNRPLEFQVSTRGGDIFVQTTIWSGADRYDRGSIVRDDKRKLTPQEAEALRRAVQRAFSAPVSDAIPRGGRDGALWHLDNRSLFGPAIEVWSPGSRSTERNTTDLDNLGRLLWRLTKIDEPEAQLY